MNPVAGNSTLSQLLIFSSRPSTVTSRPPPGASSNEANSRVCEPEGACGLPSGSGSSSTTPGVLADDLDGRLVVAQALERGGAHHPIPGPLGELDLGDQLRRNKAGVTRQLRHRRERRRVGPQRLEAGGELVERRLREAGADAPREPQFTRFEVAHQQRADPLLAPPLARQPAADHELLAAGVLELQPGAVARAGLVARVEALGDHAFEPLPAGRVEQLRAAARVSLGHPPRRAGELQLGEPLAPLLVGTGEQRFAVEVEHVEDRVDDRGRRLQSLDRVGRADVHPGLEAAEARAPLLVECDQLAVEQRLAHPELEQQPAHFRVGSSDVVAVAALEPQPAGLRVRERAHAIPFDLERPPLGVAR